MDSWIPGFMELRIHRFWGSMIQEPMDPFLCFRDSRIQCFRNSLIHGFMDSWVLGFIECRIQGFGDSVIHGVL
jgi:hypothetical protein